MFITHQRFVPRWKEWVPLATQQFKLRNLIQVLAFNIQQKKEETDSRELKNSVTEKVAYYFTLHSTTMSAPFYTSEKLENESPKWREIEMDSWRGSSSGSTDAVVIRLWAHNLTYSSDQVIAVWGVHLTGLTYIGSCLGVDTPPLKSNSLVFVMHGGYFTDPKCLNSEPKIRFSSVSISQTNVQQSYTVNLLLRLHTLQQAITKQEAASGILKQKISIGDFFGNETRGKNMLRRLLSKTKPKVNHQELIKARENIEQAKYRVQLLKEEKLVTLSRLKEARDNIETLSDSNQLLESCIMENYRLLRREVQSHREWRKGHVERRESQLHSRAMLNFRTKQLISELNLIYPITEKSPDKYTIGGVHLPDSEEFTGHDETQIAVALGFVTHVIQMTAVFLQVPLRYPVIHLGSRSRIVDEIVEKIPDSEREFPLFCRGKEKLQFHYGVYLLNKNIAQLRWLCGLPTQDLRNTLANLSSLVKMKSGGGDLDYQRKSLSSSTADLCGSTLSISSPMGSVFSLPTKSHPRTYRASESEMSAQEKETTRLQPNQRHRISKSIGSAKELMFNSNSSECSGFSKCTSDSLISKDVLCVLAPMTNSLSYSLDKGLNEYEEFAKTEIQNESSVDTAACSLNHVGSEPLLGSSLINPSVCVENSLTTPDFEAKNKFLKRWEAEKREGVHAFSDDDSEINNSPAAPNTTIIEGEFSNSSTFLNTSEQFLTRDDNRTENSEIPEDDQSGPLIPEILEPDNRLRPNIKQELPMSEDGSNDCDLENSFVDNSLFVTDSLLENVTSRTEILANQTTSFNRFRSRFKSTLESSN